MGVWYCTREDVAGAMSTATTARDNAQIDRLIESSSRGIESLCHRKFYPDLGTRFFNWPDPERQMGRSYRLWLDENELISASAVVAGGSSITDYFLEPTNYGPPYDRLELDIASTQGFNIGSTWQRNIAITGLFGYTDHDSFVGTSSNTVNTTDNIVTVANSALVGVGSLLKVGAERMITTDRNMADTTLDVGTGGIVSSAAATLLPLSGTGIYTGEVILVDAERMLVVDVAGTSVVVKRAWDGSVLAAHTAGTTVYASRAFTVLRGQLGTAAAAHAIGDLWYEWLVPGLVHQLCIAETLNAFQQEQSGYARTIGAGDNVRNASVAGIEDVRDACYRQYGRMGRSRAV